MKNNFYKIPLDFSALFPEEQDVGQTKRPSSLVIQRTPSLVRSIDEFIELIVTTHLGEYKGDIGFGFVIWDMEFENVQIEKFNTHTYPRKDLERSLQMSIEEYEHRLKNVMVEILFVYKKTFKNRKVKYFVDITVKGNLATKAAELYSKSFKFVMGPFFK